MAIFLSVVEMLSACDVNFEEGLHRKKATKLIFCNAYLLRL